MRSPILFLARPAERGNCYLIFHLDFHGFSLSTPLDENALYKPGAGSVSSVGIDGEFTIDTNSYKAVGLGIIQSIATKSGSHQTSSAFATDKGSPDAISFDIGNTR
jgi:hypothetical protein